MHADCLLTAVDQAIRIPIDLTDKVRIGRIIKSLILRPKRVGTLLRDLQTDGGGEFL
jgi:hypothetical protein